MTSIKKLMTSATQQTNATSIAIISDIHSNIHALNAVLADINRRGIKQIVNLGDILYGPIAPKATFDTLMVNASCIITIRGNQDRQIYEATPDDIASNSTLQFILDELPDEALTWLRALPFDYQLNHDVYLCHGTPTDDMIYLLEDISTGLPTVREDHAIIELLAGQTSQIILCGHTHIPRTVTLSTGQIIVNVGSAGYPAYADDLPTPHKMQTYSPHASYAILQSYPNGLDASTSKEVNGLESNNKACWQVNHIKVPYDFEASARLASQNGREDWAHALRTGRAL